MSVQSPTGVRRGEPVKPSESDAAPPWGYLPVEQYLIVSQVDAFACKMPGLTDAKAAEVGS